MKYKLKEIKKINSLWHFIKSLDRCTPKSFDKYCKKKEIIWK